MEPLPRSTAELQVEWERGLLAPLGTNLVHAIIDSWHAMHRRWSARHESSASAPRRAMTQSR